MDNKTMGETLARIDERLENLCRKMETGTPRCATNIANIAEAQKNIANLKTDYIYIRNTFIALLISVLLLFAGTAIKDTTATANIVPLNADSTH